MLAPPPESLPTVDSTSRCPPPRWALLQRHLFEVLDRAAVCFVNRYCREDGTLVWRRRWPGMDGSDDGYESFCSFPLCYVLGGGENLHRLARRQFDAVTRQFTAYGQVHREFDAYYDWMHHGESSLYLYYLGLADPKVAIDRDRALRFAAMYMGDDPESPNWDREHRLIRSPINGSRGPRFAMSAEDWCTHREVLAHYPAPYEDVAAVRGSPDPMAIADWNDDAIFADILRLMNQRMVPGDVPLNLTCTSLIANAYLYTGDERYRRWVLDYLGAWVERRDRNGGILPDNVGPDDIIGQNMAGKWWGGYYGWKWPHGSFSLLEPALIAGSNALLLSGDDRHLGLVRSQIDLLWSLGRYEDGVFKVPNRHGDRGWYQFVRPSPRLCIHLYALSWAPEDARRLDRFGDPPPFEDPARFGKGSRTSPEAWFAWIGGHHPEYPGQILEAVHAEIADRMARMAQDTGDPEAWDVHHWQEITPVIAEGLLQTTLGTPGPLYHGGLLHAPLRHFDPARSRPGLPESVAALVERVSSRDVVLTLVNTDPIVPRQVVIQAGAFGEHEFGEARRVDPAGEATAPTPIGGRALRVRLGPACSVRLEIAMRRHVHRPAYGMPFQVEELTRG